MCGILGYLPTADRAGVRSFGDALEALHHRGPDGGGAISYSCSDRKVLQFSAPGGAGSRDFPPVASIDQNEPDLLLGHRRLSIIDLTRSGHQPMSYMDRYWTVFNGEIYNYIELRDELRSAGFEFSTNSDTEVMLAAFAHWGRGMLNRLVGMFALAILDTRTDELFLARDFFGIKPLVYSRAGNQFVFASEIKALFAFPFVRRSGNANRIAEFLTYGYSDKGTETFFSDIQYLEPGHWLSVNVNTKEVSGPIKYWDLDLSSRSNLTFPQAAEELRHRFLHNVKLHMRSDVPMGACLSGGIDSSAIVMAMREIGGRDLDIHAFTYVADEESVSEESWADEVASAAKAIHHKVRPAASDLVDDLDEFVTLQDEPFGTTSIYAQYRVFRLARDAGMKVMLDGQGADELLGGYLHFLAPRMTSSLAQRDFRDTLELLTRGSDGREAYRKAFFLQCAFRLLPGPARERIRRRQKGQPKWLNETWMTKNSVRSSPIIGSGGKAAFRDARYDNTIVHGLRHLLRFEDRNSMHVSIESRVPFLTPSFANFVMSLPDSYMIDSRGNTKCVFRAAMRGLVPDAILDRRDKIGFATPEKTWIRELRGWVDSSLAGASATATPYLNVEEARKECAALTSGSRPYSSTIWRLLNTVRWCDLMGVDLKDP